MPEQDRITEIITVDAESPQGQAIDRAAGILRGGGIIGFPTETVYGLGVDALNPEAVGLLYSVKERDMKTPTSILIGRKEDLGIFVSGISREAEVLIEKFWPGPLTIVFRASARASEALTAGTGTLGIRMPGSAICLALLQKAGIPVTAPSANPRGNPPAVSAGGVMEYFRGRIDLVIDGGESARKTPSTIVDSTKDVTSIIREGAVKSGDIQAALS